MVLAQPAYFSPSPYSPTPISGRPIETFRIVIPFIQGQTFCFQRDFYIFGAHFVIGERLMSRCRIDVTIDTEEMSMRKRIVLYRKKPRTPSAGFLFIR